MIMGVGSTRDHDNSEFGINQRRIGSEQAQPSSVTDTGARLAGDRLRRVVGPLAGAVVNCSNHSRHHTLESIGGDIYLMSNDWFDLFVIRTSRHLRSKQLAAICHR